MDVMPRLQSLSGSFGPPPSKGKGPPPQGLFRRQGRQDLQRKGASWEARLQMDPDSLLKVLVEIVKALPTKYGAFLQYVPSERFALRSKEHPTSFERKLILKLHDFVLQLGADHPRPCGRLLSHLPPGTCFRFFRRRES